MRKVIFYILVAAIALALAFGIRAILLTETEDEPQSEELAAQLTDETPEPTPTEEPMEEFPEVEPMKLIGTYKITGYDPLCEHCCGKSDGITASGAMAVPGYTAAMADVPFGTVLYIDGLGTVVVQDRGPAPGVIDIACVDHDACYAITGMYEVYGEG